MPACEPSFHVPKILDGPEASTPRQHRFRRGRGVMHQPVSSALMIDFAPLHYFGVSWIVGRSTPIDPNDLSADAVEFALIEASFPRISTAPETSAPATWP